MVTMLPMVITKEEALKILGCHLDDIVAVVIAGWSDWQDINKSDPAKTATKSGRTRASWVYDAMAAKAKEVFADKPDVHVSESRGFVTLTFDNKIVMRFKKFRGRALRTSGIATQQRLEFETQQLHMDGMTVTGVVAGYLLDRIEQQQEKLAITCPLNGDNLWVIELEIPGASIETITPAVAPTPAPAVVVESATATPDEQTEEG